MKSELAKAGDAYLKAPEVLQAAILKAAADGAKATEIFRESHGAYSLDYVRQLISEARRAGKIPPRAASREP